MNIQTQDSADLNVVNHVPIAKGLSQKKDVSPVVVNCCKEKSFVKHVTNVPAVVSNLPVGFRPNLARSPTIISCYVNPHRNLYLLEALHHLISKNTVELVEY